MNWLKLFLLLPLAVILMGNEGCQDEADQRYLRMSAEVGPVKGQVIKLPDGRSIDFPYIANALFYYSLMRDPHFTIHNPIQEGYPDNGKSKLLADYDSNEAVLARYGFGRQKMSAFATGGSKEIPECIDQSAQLRLSGSVIAFELTAGGGIHVGYPGGGGIPGVPVGGGLSFENSKLSVTIQTEDPLTNRTIAIDAGHSSEVKFEFEFNYMGFAGLDFFLKTPLFNVVTAAFDESIDRLVEEHIERLNVADWVEAWQSKLVYDPVIADGDTVIAFRGGSSANVRIGDQFEVYNVHYKWLGNECESRLDYAVKQPLQPIAVVSVIEAAPDISIAKVLSSSQEYEIKAGAIVEVKQLAK